MSMLDRLASVQNIRSDVPNQELAGELAAAGNMAGIDEIAENLYNRDKNIKSDCIKVLYEIGYIKPEVISKYAADFVKLIKNKDNRLVWGAMIALSVIASIRADFIFENLETVYSVMEQGSVITIDNGIKVLAAVASKNGEYNKSIFPYLLNHLRTCRPKEVGQHSESTFPAVNAANRDEFIAALKEREAVLTGSQLARIKKLYKAASVI